MSMRTLYLVHHGKYSLATMSSDEPDGGLTDDGKEQAALTAQRLQGLPISVIHHSNLRRAIETAKILAAPFPGVTLRASSLLRECIPCVPEGYESQFEGIPSAFIERGGLQARQVFDTYVVPSDQDDQAEIVVSSGNLIRYLVCRTLGAPAEAWVHTDTQHCGITEIRIRPRR